MDRFTVESRIEVMISRRSKSYLVQTTVFLSVLLTVKLIMLDLSLHCKVHVRSPPQLLLVEGSLSYEKL